MNRACATCGNDFLIPAAELEFRADRNLAMPDRCPACRLRDRQTRNSELISQLDQSGSRGIFSTDPSAGSSNTRQRSGPRNDTGPRQFYNTVCAQCGSETQVPFVPRGDRPVYCRDCYNARRGR